MAVRKRTLAGGILAAIVLGLVWARLGPTSASAHDAHPGLNFWIAVDGVPNCSTKSADATCDLALGTTFVIDTYLDPLPSDIANYSAFQVALRHSGLTPNHDANTDAWPDCAFPAAAYDKIPDNDIVTFACTIGVAPAGPSTYTGLIGTISFTCSQSGSIAMLHGANLPYRSRTNLLEDPARIHSEDPNTAETLTINCVQGGVTPIPGTPRAGSTTAPPGTPLPPTEAARATATAQSRATATAKAVATAAKKTPTSGGGGGGGGGLGGGVIAIIVVAAVAVAGGAGFFGWRYLQGRRGGGT